MTKVVVTSGRKRKGGVKLPLPLSPHAGNRVSSRLRNRLLISFAAASLLTATARLIWLVPAVQEWRLARASLPALLRERGDNSEDARLLYHVGLRLNRQGRFDEAEGNLRRAVGLDPSSPPSRDEWARAQLGTGRVSDAFTQLRQFVGVHPQSAPAHFLLGKFYFTQKSMQRAHEEFTQAAALAPGDAEVWAYFSQTASLLSIPGKPLEAAQKAVFLAPGTARYHLLLASLLKEDNQQDAARHAYARAVSLAPGDAAMHQQYALYLSEYATDGAGRAEAEAEARRAIALEPQNGTAQLLLGRLLRARALPGEAIEPLTRAATLLPEDPAPAQELSQAYRALGNSADERRWQDTYQKRQTYVTKRHALYQQLRISPNDRKLHFRMAHLLGNHGDVEGSLRSYATALRRPPDSAQALIAVARSLIQGGHVTQALPLAERAVVIGAHNPDAREVLGDALLQSGRMDEAIGSYNYATNYLPERAPALQSRVNAWVKAHPQPLTPHAWAYQEALTLMKGQIGLQRTPPRALELAESAAQLDPGNMAYLRLLLKLQFGARRMDEAVQTARKIVHARPDDGATQAVLAVLLAERAATPQEQTEAQTLLNLIKDARELSAQWHYGTGLLALRQHDAKRAVAAFTQAARLDPDANVTFYKLAQAQRLLGQSGAAAKTMAHYTHLQNLKQQEFNLQGNVGQHPDQKEQYLTLARFYDTHKRAGEARALRDIVRRRFGRTALVARAAVPAAAQTKTASTAVDPAR